MKMIRGLLLALICGQCSVALASARSTPASAPVPQTGQTTCHQGTETILCAGSGQDGDVSAGVPWPLPRFRDNGDRTIADRLTGLAWAQDASPTARFSTWQGALDAVRALNRERYLGYGDWRLPNVNELASLLGTQQDLPAWLSSQGFQNVRGDEYWTSTTYANHPAHAWSVGANGIVSARSKTEANWVWPLRASLGLSTLPRTGQTLCYDQAGTPIECPGSGQDAETRAGVPLPTPRFLDNGDQTMTDTLTGLVWTREGGSPGPSSCAPGKDRKWQEALHYIRCLNANRFLGASDWRLPNRNELTSVIDRGQPNTARWLETQGFSGVREANYWTSTTYAPAPWNAWSVNLYDGSTTSTPEKKPLCFWPVRGP